MKSKLNAIPAFLIFAAGLAASTAISHAQDVLATGTLTDVPGAGGVFDYTLTFHNTGSEAIQSLWLGWTVGHFTVVNPTAAGNTVGWSSAVDGNSIQYGGTAANAIAAGGMGVFTFDSTSTPAQFEAATVGASVAYGVDATQFAIENTTLHSDEFTPSVQTIPEPSTLCLIAISTLGFSGILRRKFRSQ